MKLLKDINITNKRVVIRTDFNVPIKNKRILSTFRIDKSLDTIKYCLKKNAKVILISHLGRPELNDPKLSLRPVYKYLNSHFSRKIFFSEDCISEKSLIKSKDLLHGQIHLLENLRYYSEELSDSDSFAKKLSNHADIYINDAFGTSHRKHASNSAILKFFDIKAIGLLMERELKFLTDFNHSISNGLTLLLGGAKVSTKLSMIRYFLDKADKIIIGGGMAFTFLKVLGFNIGGSLFEESMYEEAKFIIEKSKTSKADLYFPEDFLCSKSIDSVTANYRKINEIQNKEKGFDIGSITVKRFSSLISDSKFIIWNGPLGVTENEKFANGTKLLATEIVSLTRNKSLVSIIGGGDTAGAIIALNLEDSFSHVSTGGGASLKLLSGETLQLLKSWEENEK